MSLPCACGSPWTRHWPALLRLQNKQAASSRAASTNSAVTVSMPASGFSVHNTDGTARTGVLHAKHGEIATPAALLYTFRGSPLNLTPDLLSSLGPDARALHIDASQL